MTAQNWISLIIVVELLCLGLVFSQSCDQGWFGTNCQYLCHCTNDNCNLTSGQCTGGDVCQHGWFGPSCQYVDLVLPADVTLDPLRIPLRLTDDDDTTCVSPVTQSVHLKWDTGYHFTWMRLTLGQNPEDLAGKLRVQLQHEDDTQPISCAGQVSLGSDGRTLDVHCEHNETVKQVHLLGEAVKHLCSIHISGGRNVALKQTTRNNNILDASSAVSGNVDGAGLEGTCNQTAVLLSGIWELDFNRDVMVDRVVVYIAETNETQSQTLQLSIYTREGDTKYTVVTRADTLVYQIVPDTIKQHSNKVTMQLTGQSTQPDVPLCEVQVFGDTMCPLDQFGRDCEHTCNCSDSTVVCLASTGECVTGCLSGYTGDKCTEVCQPSYYGDSCVEKCSSRCEGNLCNHVTGVCTSCPPGFQGDFCIQKCPPKFYGMHCQQECGFRCMDQLCDSVTGVCKACYPGWIGDMCNQECPLGMYGQDCETPCGRGCLGETCHHVTGACGACLPGLIGEFCDETCAHGTYGSGCRSNCSEQCVVDDTVDEAVCHRVTGVCLVGCKQGYEGSTCNAERHTSNDEMIMKLAVSAAGAFVFGLIVASLVCGLCYWRRVKKKSPGDAPDVPGYDHVELSPPTEHYYEGVARPAGATTMTSATTAPPGTVQDSCDNPYINNHNYRSSVDNVYSNSEERASGLYANIGGLNSNKAFVPDQGTYANFSNAETGKGAKEVKAGDQSGAEDGQDQNWIYEN